MKIVKHIVDTTMRDGEQSPGIAMTKTQKILIARILDAAGVYQIEAGIPALNSYEMDTIRLIMQARKNAKISVWNRLVPEDIKKSVECEPDIIHISTPVSYVLIYSKLNKNKTWVAKNLSTCVGYAVERGFEVTVGFEDASRADITFMATLAGQLKDMGVNRIRYADTVGVLTPSRTKLAVKELIEFSGMEIELHTHNDLGMAVPNTILGALGGADYLDTTISGLGERAGNCDFLKLVHASRDVMELNISNARAKQVQKEVLDILALG